ncbi:MAG: hypothetical protein ACRDSE_05570 [Pseudonocardiaceae bacterium]
MDTSGVGPAPVGPAVPSAQPGGVQGLYHELLDPSSGRNVTTGGLADLMMGPLGRFEPPPPPASGQGFRFDVEGATELIKDIDALLEEELDAAQRESQRMTEILPPGRETASMQMVEIANRSGVSYNGYLIATISRLKRFRDALIAVRDGKAQQDDDIASGYNKG